MHWENLEPLLNSWPVLLAAIAAVAILVAGLVWIFGKPGRRQRDRNRGYRLRELRWRAKMKAIVMLNRTRTLKLTDQRDRLD